MLDCWVFCPQKPIRDRRPAEPTVQWTATALFSWPGVPFVSLEETRALTSHLVTSQQEQQISGHTFYKNKLSSLFMWRVKLLLGMTPPPQLSQVNGFWSVWILMWHTTWPLWLNVFLQTLQIWPLPGVNLKVPQHVPFVTKTFATDGARKGPLSGVSPHVAQQVTALNKLLPT